MQLNLFNYQIERRFEWLALWAILHLQLECAYAANEGDMLHFSIYANAIKKVITQ